MTFINQYSMLWSSLIILGLAAFFLLRKQVSLARILALGGVAGLLLASWFLLRADPATTTDLADFQAEIGAGEAVLLELQSPY